MFFMDGVYMLVPSDVSVQDYCHLVTVGREMFPCCHIWQYAISLCLWAMVCVCVCVCVERWGCVCVCVSYV